MTLQRLSNGILRNIRRYPKDGHKIVFTHIPKCAGTAVGDAIGGTVQPFSRSILNYRAARQAGLLVADSEITNSGIRDDLKYLRFLLCYKLNSGFRYVGGHYPVSRAILENYSDEFHFVTLLRDPVDRWKSDYIFQSGLKTGDPETKPRIGLEDQFDAVTSSGRGLLMGSMMCSMMTGSYPRVMDEAVEMVGMAGENLAMFSVVGIVGHMEKFKADLKLKTGIKINIQRKNESRNLYRGNDQGRFEELVEFLGRTEINARIEELCRADMGLYNRFTQQD